MERIPRGSSSLEAGFLLAALLAVLGGSYPASAQEEPPQEELQQTRPGTHFVVLIDDSGDMRHYQSLLEKHLPELLYADGGNRPSFRPGHDRLTVLFFTIHSFDVGNDCKLDARYSVLPEHMFHVQLLSSAGPETGRLFARQLREWLGLRCRFKGSLSPIVTAMTVVLPYLGERLAAEEQYDRTILVIATNAFFNSSTSPAFELRNLVRDIPDASKLENTGAAEQLVRQVAPLFRFDSPQEGWSKVCKQGDRRLYLFVFEAVPLVPYPRLLLTYRPEIELDRVATSDQELVVVPRSRTHTDLRIALPDAAGPAPRLHPYRMHWRYQAADGGGWRVGNMSFPDQETVLQLDDEGQRLQRENEQLVVPLAGLHPAPVLSSGDDVPTGDGRLQFSVAFRLDTGGVYDHLVLESDPQQVELRLTAPSTVDGGIFFPDALLDNVTLAGLFRSSDRRDPAGGTTQEMAQERLLDRREWYRLLILVCSLLSMALILLAVLSYLFRTEYHRPFKPRIGWQPAEEVVVDFNRPAASRVLLGTLTVTNPEEVPRFGRLLRNTEQPTRLARLRLTHRPLRDTGISVAATGGAVIGFLGKAQRTGAGSGAPVDDAELVLQSDEAISHGKRVFVFLAAEKIEDLQPLACTAAEEDLVHPLELSLQVEWTEPSAKAVGRLQEKLTGCIRIRPEEPRLPEVAYSPAPTTLFFKKGERLEVGHFTFRSRAGHRFARCFTADYLLRATSDHLPLAGEPLQLALSNLQLPARETIDVPVLLHCDGEIVCNPDPIDQRYELALAGPCHTGSQTGPHQLLLHRDPTRTEIALEVVFQGDTYELYWDQQEHARVRTAAGSAKGKATIEDGRLVFAVPYTAKFHQDHPPLRLLDLRVASSADAGRGYVAVRADAMLSLDGHLADCLHLRPGRSPEDLLVLYDGELPQPRLPAGEYHLQVADTDRAQRRSLHLEVERIERIDGARVAADQCRAEVLLDILVCGDNGEQTRRRLTLVVPLHLEQRPGLRWLCIDFGTSAIAAGLGNAADGSFRMINLQEVPALADGQGLGTEDPSNAEAGTPFLPSWVICDADQRAGEPPANLVGRPQGFPLYQPASLRPGDPSFLSLPAMVHQLSEQPGRIIFSLKSWLARSSPSIRLADPITFQRNGVRTVDKLVPLDEVVESGFAALTEAYLKADPLLRADQVVLCHPNTFTAHHRQRLHDIATRALMPKLGLASASHIHLISESDAVAYHYCSQVMRDEPRGGQERLLIYDFGGGTLDLTIVRLTWQRDPCYPTEWVTEARLGVPVAGNAIDEALARIVDEVLRAPGVLDGVTLSYRYPVVEEVLPADETERARHRQAIQQLWRAIREAKHAWDGSAPFEVKIAGRGTKQECVVHYTPEADQIPFEVIDTSVPAVRTDGTDIYLSIPGVLIRHHPRIEELAEFVCDTVVGEAIAAAGLQPDDIDTLIVSGRGAQWPGLRERLCGHFPDARRPSFLDSGVSMKEAVVRGAIARQELLGSFDTRDVDATRATLAILRANDTELVSEDRWGPDSEIDLRRSPTFRLVQVGLRNPDPRQDLRSLRRHFYTDLSDRRFLRDGLWGDDPRLYVEKVEENGRLEILLKNSNAQAISVFSSGAAHQVTNPPWPIGQVLLEPEE